MKENRIVKNVLFLKIIYTLVGIITYLFLPESLIVSLDIGSSESIRFIRSLGLSYTGLLFIYTLGYFQIIMKNKYPINVVLFGIFMNGGALILSVIFIFIDYYNIGFNLNIIRSTMLFLFFIITLMLIISIIMNYKKYKNEIIWNILWDK